MPHFTDEDVGTGLWRLDSIQGHVCSPQSLRVTTAEQRLGEGAPLARGRSGSVTLLPCSAPTCLPRPVIFVSPH